MVWPRSARSFGDHHQAGRLFDQLLVAALDGALALAQAHHIAVLVGQYLELDMARPLDELLHVQVAVAEGASGLAGGLLEHCRQLVSTAADAHPATAAAGHRLQNHWVADALGPFQRACASLSMIPSDPGRIGTPAFFIVCRAVDFSPIIRVTSGGGPMNLMFDARHTSAKFAFSLSRP